MKVFNIFSTVSLFALSVKAGFYDHFRRTELYEIMDKSIPVMRITMPKANWTEMVDHAQAEAHNELQDYEVTADLKFIYEENEESYKIKMKLGGKSSAVLSKPGFNIKIKNDKSLHGTKNFRLRSDQREPSMMRSRLTTDILQKSGLLAIEVGYTELYINDEYMGFWVVSDSIKKNWITRKFGIKEEDVKTVYKCDKLRFDDGVEKAECVNINDDYADNMEPLYDFINKVNAAKTRADLEEFMEVENFLKYMAWEWLMGSWDHFLSSFSHNMCWFLQPNGKWAYIPFDHDIELGEEVHAKFFPYMDDIYDPNDGDKDYDYTHISFADFEHHHPIIKILVHDDDTEFRKCLGDIISKAFNPEILFPHIDEVKNYIAPYVKKEKELNVGKYNKKGLDVYFSYEHFLLNTESTFVYNLGCWLWYKGYGLKDWILGRYEYAARYYGINYNSTNPEERHKLIEPRPEPVILPYITDITYLDPKTNETYTERPEGPGYAYVQFGDNRLEYTLLENYDDNRVPTIGVNEYLRSVENGEENNEAEAPSSEEKCWAKAFGYDCCARGCKTKVVVVDDDGSWGAQNKEWCGIPKDCKYSEECPGSKLGYSCCEGCVVYDVDDTGSWGYEDDQWCSTKTSCLKN